MKKAIAAAFCHCCDAATPEQRHHFCPKKDDTWCKYQNDVIHGTNLCKDKPGIHIKLKGILQPVFMSLASNELLAKCLHGKTQNNNESLNGVIWKRCPKDVYLGKTTLSMGVASAIIGFDEGATGVLNVMTEYCIEIGNLSSDFCLSHDSGRITEMDRKIGANAKMARKRLHARRKGYGDQNREREGLSYGPGLVEILSE